MTDTVETALSMIQTALQTTTMIINILLNIVKDCNVVVTGC